MFENLKQYKILLASNSPRRQELLKAMDVDFEVVTRQGINENFPESLKPKFVPEFLALKKAAAYRDMLEQGDNLLLITADTVVISQKCILGKPRNEFEAKSILQYLQGKSHKVVSGVALTTHNKQVSFSCKTKVTMQPLSDSAIDYYISKYKPFDKAGAYGIQEWIGLTAIESIDGSFQNVMGLPTQKLFAELLKF